jgi:hypothetical protein
MVEGHLQISKTGATQRILCSSMSLAERAETPGRDRTLLMKFEQADRL